MATPTPQQFGLDEKMIAELERVERRRNDFGDTSLKWIAGVSGIGVLLFLMGVGIKLYIAGASWGELAKWAFLGLGALAVIVFFVAAIALIPLGAVLSLLVWLIYPAPNLKRLRQYREALQDFRRSWGRRFWNSFWDSIEPLGWRHDPIPELPHSRLGYRQSTPELLKLPRWYQHVELYLVSDGRRYILKEVKQDQPVDVHIVVGLLRVLDYVGAHQAVLISRSGYTDEAIKHSLDQPIKLGLAEGAEELADLLSAMSDLDTSVISVPHVTPEYSSSAGIIKAYGQFLASAAPGGASVFANEADLPFPKDTIRRALVMALCETRDAEERRHLENALVLLEGFLPPDEYALFRGFDEAVSGVLQAVKESSTLSTLEMAKRIAESSPRDSEALREQIRQRHTHQLDKRLKQINTLRKPFG